MGEADGAAYMIFTRSFLVPGRQITLYGLAFTEYVTYHTLEGRDGVIDVFDEEGKSTPNGALWNQVDEMKRQENKVKKVKR